MYPTSPPPPYALHAIRTLSPTSLLLKDALEEYLAIHPDIHHSSNVSPVSEVSDEDPLSGAQEEIFQEAKYTSLLRRMDSYTTTDFATDTDLEPESVDEDRADLDAVDLLPSQKRALQHETVRLEFDMHLCLNLGKLRYSKLLVRVASSTRSG
ncbi:hypothetical protein B0H13DRAFT_1852079 [Mycena leptocephala]|nr:hypothetical protein B0H13DRAFT_1852079 [Mycena leptocephala]